LKENLGEMKTKNIVEEFFIIVIELTWLCIFKTWDTLQATDHKIMGKLRIIQEKLGVVGLFT